MSARSLSRLDKLLAGAQRSLREFDAPRAHNAPENYPARGGDQLSPQQRRHVAGLMRVNHAGEVAAQALYRGQARVARDTGVRTQLLTAANEERDHLQWCAQRLRELNSQPSRFSPLWFAGAYAIGAAAGLAGDRWSLGFVAETERQVEAHLEGHLRQLPHSDERSRQIVTQMKADEQRHGDDAVAAGGADLPGPIKRLMRAAAKVMTGAAYWV